MERAHSRILSLAGIICAYLCIRAASFLLSPPCLGVRSFDHLSVLFGKQQHHLRTSYKPLHPQRRHSHITAPFLHRTSPRYIRLRRRAMDTMEAKKISRATRTTRVMETASSRRGPRPYNGQRNCGSMIRTTSV
jgi:hypothetical protein